MESWQQQRKLVEKLIIAVSQKHGGDEEAWLEEYTQEVVAQNNTNLAEVIVALTDILGSSDTLII